MGTFRRLGVAFSSEEATAMIKAYAAGARSDLLLLVGNRSFWGLRLGALERPLESGNEEFNPFDRDCRDPRRRLTGGCAGSAAN